jgi:HNH endonuclease
MNFVKEIESCKMKFLSLVFILKFFFACRGRKIPLHNKKGEIVRYTIVSSKDYKRVNESSWHLHGNRKYVVGADWRLNRFVFIELMGNNIDSKIRVDHINNNPLDNRRSNLRCIFRPKDDRNKSKIQGCSSGYHNVSWNDERKIWNVRIYMKGRSLHAYYEKEEHAAHQYNLWVDQYELKTAPKNKVSVPDDFVPWISKWTGKKFPKNIYKSGEQCKVIIAGTYYGSYDTVEKAMIKRDEMFKKIEEDKEKKITCAPILRNSYGIPIIELFNKKGKKVSEVKVDEEKYYDLMHYSWCLIVRDKCVYGHVDGRTVRMPRYVMNYDGEYEIDHIDGDYLDNRVSKLRIATPQQNSMNKGVSKANKSGCTGVFELKNGKYRASICIKKKQICLGTFLSKDDAIKARKCAEVKYFGKWARKN